MVLVRVVLTAESRRPDELANTILTRTSSFSGVTRESMPER